jgi:hypothetical protein
MTCDPAFPAARPSGKNLSPVFSLFPNQVIFVPWRRPYKSMSLQRPAAACRPICWSQSSDLLFISCRCQPFTLFVDPVQSAIDKGVFSTVRSGKNPGPPKLDAILTAAQQLASAMTYLHERHNITHGDLTGGNVLLTTSPSTPSGLACKARFGSSHTLCCHPTNI